MFIFVLILTRTQSYLKNRFTSQNEDKKYFKILVTLTKTRKKVRIILTLL